MIDVIRVKIEPCTITIHWPAAELFPNKSGGRHWSSKQDAKESARNEAYSAALGSDIGDTTIDHAVTIIVSPPDNRRRDVDGILSALKPSLDGLARALDIDDYHFNPINITRLPPVDGGRITIRVEDDIPF